MKKIETPNPKISAKLLEVANLFAEVKEFELRHTVSDNLLHTAVVSNNGVEKQGSFLQLNSKNELDYKRQYKRAAKVAVYRAFVNLTGKRQPWGCLTGVRPIKLLRELSDKALYSEVFDVSENKAELARKMIEVQDSILPSMDGIAVYIGIPFCRTRCSYCSFPGRIAKKGEMESYIKALKKEIKACEYAVKNHGVSIYSIYIGGGTPTSLSASLLEELFGQINESFGHVDEFTLEAGRPDTLDEEKLHTAKAAGVTRICINPQSMVESTLKTIGREHSPQDIVNAFKMARKLGFDDINMDVIAGLPGETLTDFEYTMKRISELSPESITVHTLSLKRGSVLKNQQHIGDNTEVPKMVDKAAEYTRTLKMRPYYLYRQKYMTANLENTGYAKPGFESRYNIGMMEDISTVLALGVGAISKLITNGRIFRIPNYKDLKLYIEGIEDICSKKRDFFRLDSDSARYYTNANGIEGEE